MTGALQWISTWIIMIVVLVALAQSRWGGPIVYWFLWLGVTLLVVTHADELSNLMNVGALNLNG